MIIKKILPYKKHFFFPFVQVFVKFVFLICIFSSCGKFDSHSSIFSDLYKDAQARKMLIEENKEENKDLEKSLDLNLSILENQPEQASIHSNMGVVYQALKKDEEALKSFNEAERLAEEQRNTYLFEISFNKGVFHGAKKEYEPALTAYQKALIQNPSSMEVVTNIELLKQQSDKQKQQEQQQKQNQKQDQKNQQDGKQDSQQKQDKGDDKKDKDKDKDKDEKQKSDNDKKQDSDPKDDEKDKKDEPPQQDRKQTGRYKPRPFKGDSLSEGDVKKILGELSQQDQKIRSNFNKKERKEGKNEKDW